MSSNAKTRLIIPGQSNMRSSEMMGSTYAGEAIAKATSERNSKQLLGAAQARQVKAAVAELDQQHALTIAKHQVEQAAAFRIRSVKLEGERLRAEIRDKHNAISGDLADEQSRKSSEAIITRVQSNNRIVQIIERSNCTPADQQQLKELAKLIARNGFERTSQGGCLGNGFTRIGRSHHLR